MACARQRLETSHLWFSKTGTRRIALGSLSQRLPLPHSLDHPVVANCLVGKGTLSMASIPQAVPSCSLLLTVPVSALVLTRGQVAGSQAPVHYTAGGNPAAQHWNADNFCAGHFVNVTDILPFRSTSGVWENVEESSPSNNLGSCLMCNK